MSCPKYKLSMKNKNMKKIYIHKIHLILCFTSVLCFGLPINAQQNAKNGAADNNKKAWEIGIGATGLQMTRFNVINFHTNNKGGYTVGTNKKDFILEYNRIKKWYNDNKVSLKFSPFSKKINGETLKNRIIVFTFLALEKMHLIGLFAKFYCKG